MLLAALRLWDFGLKVCRALIDKPTFLKSLTPGVPSKSLSREVGLRTTGLQLWGLNYALYMSGCQN